MTVKIRADDGNAFSRPPVWSPDGQQVFNGSTGMSLRDYFAAAALTGLLATDSEWRRWYAEDGNGSTWQNEAAWDAYSLADAMLAQRLKDPSA